MMEDTDPSLSTWHVGDSAFIPFFAIGSIGLYLPSIMSLITIGNSHARSCRLS